MYVFTVKAIKNGTLKEASQATNVPASGISVLVFVNNPSYLQYEARWRKHTISSFSFIEPKTTVYSVDLAEVRPCTAPCR